MKKLIEPITLREVILKNRHCYFYFYLNPEILFRLKNGVLYRRENHIEKPVLDLSIHHKEVTLDDAVWIVYKENKIRTASRKLWTIVKNIYKNFI